MIISLSVQMRLVFFSILAGVLTGFLFDFYRTIRGFENIHKLLIIIEDILFWFLTAIIIFIFLLYTNYAFITLYVYVYIAIGIFVYIKLISKTFTYLQYSLIQIISKVIRMIINFTLFPFKLLINKVFSKNKRNF